jgi:hypothetical protein
MEPKSLTQFYDDLKQHNDGPATTAIKMYRVGGAPGPGGITPDAMAWKNKVMHHCHGLKDKCLKHVLLDVYCKIIPLDKDYVDGNMGTMKADIDNMLAQKNMTPTQYFTSAFESTGAPFVKYLIEQADLISKAYMEKEEEELKDAQDNNIDLPEPPEPETTDEDTNSQLVDLENDTEYDDFVEQLKKKTIDKIVNDVSAIIAGEKQEKDMSFNPVNESTINAAMEYLEKALWNENSSPEQKEQMIGLAIRESTLHEFDKVFELQGRSFNEYTTRVRLGKGYVINESAINYIKENA